MQDKLGIFDSLDEDKSKKDGRSATAISRKAGMSGPVLSNMINGNWMSLKALILITEEMGLEIVIQKKEKQK